MMTAQLVKEPLISPSIVMGGAKYSTMMNIATIVVINVGIRLLIVADI